MFHFFEIKVVCFAFCTAEVWFPTAVQRHQDLQNIGTISPINSTELQFEHCREYLLRKQLLFTTVHAYSARNGQATYGRINQISIALHAFNLTYSTFKGTSNLTVNRNLSLLSWYLAIPAKICTADLYRVHDRSDVTIGNVELRLISIIIQTKRPLFGY